MKKSMIMELKKGEGRIGTSEFFNNKIGQKLGENNLESENKTIMSN